MVILMKPNPKRRTKRTRELDRSEMGNQGAFELKLNLTGEEVLELARDHFPEENGIEETSSGDNCISFEEPTRSWLGGQVMISTCPDEETNKTEVTVTYYHRKDAVKRFIEKLT